jgi:NhaP-type Na+/H+ or K+/H+ antiporter
MNDANPKRDILIFITAVTIMFTVLQITKTESVSTRNTLVQQATE